MIERRQLSPAAARLALLGNATIVGEQTGDAVAALTLLLAEACPRHAIDVRACEAELDAAMRAERPTAP